MEKTLLSLLPPAYARETETALKKQSGTLCELRLRVGRLSSLTLRGRDGLYNLPLSFVLSDSEMREIFSRTCGGSVHAFEESLKEGYLSLPSGVRVGVGGRAVTKNGKTATISAVKSLVFRIPHKCPHAADTLLSLFKERACGILLFSPPGGGKTTRLREFAREISRGENPKRCAVIDTRGEFFGFEKECLIDLLSGYPKAEGAEIAVRTLTPEVLVMDEIGEKEIGALLSLSSLGVPVVASIHGKTAKEVCASPARALLEKGIFDLLFDAQKNQPAFPKESV